MRFVKALALSATSLAAGVTSLDVSSLHLLLIATSFICATQGGNDVFASLEMMLNFTQMILCLTAQIKKSESKRFRIFCERAVKRCVNTGKNSKKYTVKLLDKLEFVNLTPYDSACDFCLTHNGYGRVNALLYENELSHRAYV